MREGWWGRWGTWVIGLLLFSLLAIGVVSYTLWYKLFRKFDQPPFANTEELFKYGSIGNENNSGLPYWIWLVLPQDVSPIPAGRWGLFVLRFFMGAGSTTSGGAL